jgi:DNA-binding response OmpR family regulator
VLRRTGRQTVAHPEPVARSGRILLDPAAYDALVDGEPVQLSAREFELLRFFLQHPRRAFTRAQLIAMVWGAQARMDPRSIDVHIRRLRAALTRRNIPVTAIVTVRGVGYRFNADTVDEETSGGATGSGRIGSRKRQRS